MTILLGFSLIPKSSHINKPMHALHLSEHANKSNVMKHFIIGNATATARLQRSSKQAQQWSSLQVYKPFPA